MTQTEITDAAEVRRVLDESGVATQLAGTLRTPTAFYAAHGNKDSIIAVKLNHTNLTVWRLLGRREEREAAAALVRANLQRNTHRQN